MYSREIDGQEYTFGVSGKLIRNVLLMYDRQTNSYWSQLIGEAVEGDLIGTKLEYLPSWFMTWAEWKELHPDTLALRKGRGSAYDPYDGYYLSNQAGVLGETIQDDRLETKEFVVGVELADRAIAYPYSALSLTPLVNDIVGDTPLLVVFDATNTTSAVYDRRAGDQTLTFTLDESNQDEMVDAETGSRWDARRGLALVGDLAGTQLTRVKSTNVFWFGWKDFHPETLVYGQTE